MNHRWWFIMLFFALWSGFLPFKNNVLAGGGKIVDGKLNLNIYFSYDESDLNSWEIVFRDASRLLYNATEKQLQFGILNVFNDCPAAKETADIWIIKKGGAASSGGFAVFGESGKHIELPPGFKNAFTVVHELGHHIWGLYDEYRNVDLSSGEPKATLSEDAPGGSDPDAFCSLPGPSSGPTDTASIMDIHDEATEFCTTSGVFGPGHDHNVGTSTKMNGQQYFYGPIGIIGQSVEGKARKEHKFDDASAWAIIGEDLSGTGFILTLPSSQPQNDISGHKDDEVEWQLMDCSRLREVLSIDTSGSMSGDKITLAKTGASIFVDLVKIGEDLGVTSFASTASINFPLQPIIDESTKAAARTAIDGIVASGDTSIGEGLRASLNEILMRTSRTNNEFILLISDGMHQTGEDPNNVIPDLIAEKVKVFTVGVGSDADVNLLKNIADQTKGKFFPASSAASLPGIFTQISALARGNGLIGQIQDFIHAGSQVVKKVLLDVFNNETTFVLSWAGSDLDLILVRPDGTIIDAAFAGANPETIEFVSRSN